MIPLVAFAMVNTVAYFDEGIRSFKYLTVPGDWVALIIYTILFSILPLILYYSQKKEAETRLLVALLGFIPVTFLIMLFLI